MGNRYVWEKFNVGYEYRQTTGAVSSVGDVASAVIGYELSFDKATGYYTLGGDDIKTITPGKWAQGYYAMTGTGTSQVNAYQFNGNLLWYITNGGSSGYQNRFIMLDSASDISGANTSDANWKTFTVKGRERAAIRGDTSYGYVTSASDSAYSPGASGNIWYTSRGFDIIDASAVSYSTDKPERGKPVTITVTPSTGKKYGGTVYYQYYYSTGGSWTAIGSKTTETSKTITVPADAKTFQVRVLASDDLGFTSTTYTTGARLNVQSIQAYIGAGGTARRVAKMYIGVNGVAREVIAGYVGDASGKARKWF